MALLKSKTQPDDLTTRIAAIRAEIDAFIDARAAAAAKECPGVPVALIRTSITRGMSCQCASYLLLQDKEEAA